MTLFKDMNLPAPLLAALDHLKFVEPTPIQLQTLPTSLDGKDILGSAQTGTGKTLAFSLPLLAHLLKNPQAMALVLTPTRELAQQVALTIKQLVGNTLNIRSALLIGGEPIGKQFQQLRNNPRIIVGTPGRVIDHLERKTLKKNTFSFLVLDETDRMFDMGFGIQLDQIISQLPIERQTLMFSATFPQKIEKLAAKYMVTPQRFFVDSEISISDKLKQETMFIKESDKYDQLLTQLNSREGSIIVFVKTKINADRLATQLVKADHNAAAIHGDLRQHKRERVMSAFRQGRYRIMIATDVAARGLDVPQLQHVINYDLPQASEDFIHRIGRTARNGAEGCALTFISMKDRKLWDDIQRLINPDMAPAPRSSGRFDRNERSTPGRGSSFGRKPSGSNFRQGRSEDRNGGSSDRPWASADRGPRSSDRPGNRSDSRPAGSSDRPWASADRGPRTDRPGSRPDSRPAGNSDRPWASADRGPRTDRPGSRPNSRPAGSSDRPWASADRNQTGNNEGRPSERGNSDRRPSGSFSSDGRGYGPKKPARSGDFGGAPGRGNFRAKV